MTTLKKVGAPSAAQLSSSSPAGISVGALMPTGVGQTGAQGPPGPQGEQGPPGGTIISGWWQYNVSLNPPPLTGQIRTSPDPPVVGSPYTIYLHTTDDDGLSWSGGSVSAGDQIRLRDTSGDTQTCTITNFTVTVPGSTGYATIQTNLLAATGTILKNARVEVSVIKQPTPGPPGPQGPPSVIQMTQAAYDALTPKDPNTLYVIVG
jgi:hypothetical protein